MFINLFVLEYKQILCHNYSLLSVNSMLSSLNAFFSFVGWNDLQVKTLKIQRRIFSGKSKELTKFEYEKLLTLFNAEKSHLILPSFLLTEC